MLVYPITEDDGSSVAENRWLSCHSPSESDSNVRPHSSTSCIDVQLTPFFFSKVLASLPGHEDHDKNDENEFYRCPSMELKQVKAVLNRVA